MRVTFGVLGSVTAWDATGSPIALKGPRHRAVLARLIVARGRVVPVGHLVDDLWVAPPPGAVSAVRTFVAALRRALEPDRPPRTPPALLVTEGPGYALHTAPDTVDAWRFERAVTGRPPGRTPGRPGLARPGLDAQPRSTIGLGSAAGLDEALALWRGPAYAEFAHEPWARAERARLAELRLRAVELRADALISGNRGAEAIPDLDAHVTEHPWREDAWRLLALALYRSGRQGDALAVLRRARTLLTDQLGVDPGPALRVLEGDILQQAGHLTSPAPGSPGGSTADPARRPAVSPADPSPADGLLAGAAADFDRIAGAGARLDTTIGLLRTLAVAGGLDAARRHRTAAIAAAEELGDPELSARVIGAYDVPAIWTRSDDPAQATAIVAAARRTLRQMKPPGNNTTHVAGNNATHADAASSNTAHANAAGNNAAHADAAGDAARARLLATIALESRGGADPHAREGALEAERIARRLGEPALLAFALNGVFMRTFHRTGLAPERDAIGAELIDLAAGTNLVTAEVLGHLIRIQARSGRADFTVADRHAAAADDLAARHGLPLVTVFTSWYRALRQAGRDPDEGPYRAAAQLLDGAGMPGLEHGLLPLALLCLRIRHGLPPGPDDPNFGPYEPWVRPVVLLGRGRGAEATDALRHAPDPPADLLTEAMWALLGTAAVELGDRPAAQRVRTALRPAAGELAGAASGLLTLGPVADLLARLPA